MTVATLRHQAISASAGSGKTWQLAHRYIGLLLRGVEPDRICALTFTRKAAGEIFESIAHYLAQGARDETEARRLFDNVKLDAEGAALARTRDALKRLMGSLHRCHTGTLDAFGAAVARAFSTELGLPAAFTLADSGGFEGTRLRQRALDGFYDPAGLERARTRAFREAFRIATFGREERGIERLFEQWIADDLRVLRTVPDERRWGHPNAIWPNGCPWAEEAGSVQAAAEQALCALEEVPGPVGEQLRAWAVLASAYDRHSRWSKPLDGNKAVQDLWAGIAALREGHFAPVYRNKSQDLSAAAPSLYVLLHHLMHIEIQRALVSTQGLYKALALYEARHTAAAREASVYTFDDIQHILAERRLCSGETGDGGDGGLAIDYRLDARFDHWLLDEFQDTSDIQWRGLENLIDEIMQDTTGARSFFFVGDIKQAIYGWRGGNAELFERVVRRYRGGFERPALDRSFRSAPPIIKAVNRVFGSLPDGVYPEAGVEAWRSMWRPHAAAPQAPREGFVARWETAAASFEDLGQAAAALLRHDRPLERGMTAAVLVRTNKQGGLMAESLRRACPDMPIVLEGESELLDNPPAAALMALIRAAARPGDTLAEQHVEATPLADLPLWRDTPRDQRPRVLLEALHRDGLRACCLRWGAFLLDPAPDDTFSRRRLDDLLDACALFEAGPYAGEPALFPGFVEKQRLDEAASNQAVRILTVHKAKGLGFDWVLLPFDTRASALGKADDGLIAHPDNNAIAWILQAPRTRVLEADPVLAEDLRQRKSEALVNDLCVLYVALTRAKRVMHLLMKAKGTSTPGPDWLLRKALAGESPRCIVLDDLELTEAFALGARDRALTMPERPQAAPATPRRATPRMDAPRSRLRRREPSAEEAREMSKAAFFDPGRRRALERGSALHDALAGIGWLDDMDDPDPLSRRPRAAVWSVDAAKTADEIVRHLLNGDNARRLLGRPKAEADLWREKRFDLVLDNAWVTGIFDRVVLERGDDGAWTRALLLDYKTDRPAPDGSLDVAVAVYRPQMLLYRRSLSLLSGLDESRIETVLWFVVPDEAVRITARA